MGEEGLGLVGIEDAYPLSPSQAGMLFHSLAEPGSGVYLGYICTLLPADLDLERFRAAWQSVVRRHGALRTQFVWEGLDEPVQVVREQIDLSWTMLDWRHLGPEAESSALDEHLDAALRDGVDLANAPLMKLTLILRADGTRRFLWISHHAIGDDWSAIIVLREIARIYGAGAQDHADALPRTMAFRNFVDWSARRERDADHAYWREVLADLDAPTRTQILPGEAPPDGGLPYRVTDLGLGVDASNRLRSLAASLRVTLAAVVTSVWAVVLHRCSERDDVLFGVATTQRPHALAGIENAVGNFVATLVARVRIDHHASMRELILARHRDALAARRHDGIGLSELQRLSGLPADQPLFDTIVSLEQGALETILSDAVQAGFYSDLRIGGLSNFPLSFIVFPDAGMRLRLIYDINRCHDTAADMILRMARTALAALPSHLDASPVDLPILDQPGPTIDTSAAPAPMGPVHVAFIARARATPDVPAVICADRVIGYGALDQASETLARRLTAAGAGLGDRIAIYLETGLGFPVAILAALRAGCAYVPLDARYPSERLNRMLEDCDAALVLTDAAHRDQLPSNAPPVLLIDEPEAPGLGDSEPPIPSPQDPAYQIYTSGSTGTPKGVVVTHANLSSSTAARLAFYDEAPRVFLLLSSFSFDSSVAGIFWTLCGGGTLVLAPADAEKDMGRLGEIIADNRVTHSLCLPSLLEMILNYVPVEKLSSLRVLIAAGEALPKTVVELHHERLPKARLFNEYGPTEATVWSTAVELDSTMRGERVPIGRAIPGTMLVLRDSCMRAVPPGLPAELYLGGPGIAAGYFNAPDATARGFVDTPEGRLYRTGDLVRRRPDGMLDYLGRTDGQIKIRGYRVEPAEIETALTRRPDVRQAVVMAQGSGARAVLSAYIVPESKRPVAHAELRDYLARLLPVWMAPTHFTTLQTLPRTATGKIDLQALPPPEPRQDPDDRPTLPRTPLERDLAKVWKRVLGIDRNLGVNEDFFDLGGHSLLSIRLINEIEAELGLKTPLSSLGRIGTIERQAELLESDAAIWEPTATPAVSPAFADPFAALSAQEQRELRAYMAGWAGEPGFDGAWPRVLNREGTLAPLFWCFNGGIEFTQMARHLGPDQPVYGLRSGNLVVETTPQTHQRNNRRVAIQYLPDLLRIQPDGPYFLGGNCQGAAIVMELALILHGLGQAVGMVCLMEAVPVQPFHGRVALIFGRDSTMNPYREFSRPELRWRRQFARSSCDLVSGGHGEFFEEPNIQELARVVRKRLAEARLDTPLPLPDTACKPNWLGPRGLPQMSVGQTECLQVSLRNASPHVWGPTRESGLALIGRWLAANGSAEAGPDCTAEIETRWSPGETRELALQIQAPATPGPWKLALDLVEQGVAGFSARGARPLLLETDISARAPEAVNAPPRRYPPIIAEIDPRLTTDLPTMLSSGDVDHLLANAISARRLAELAQVLAGLDPEQISDAGRALAQTATAACRAVIEQCRSVQTHFLDGLAACGLIAEPLPIAENQQFHSFGVLAREQDRDVILDLALAQGYFHLKSWGPGALRSALRTRSEIQLIRTDATTTRLVLRWRTASDRTRPNRRFTPQDLDYELIKLPKSLWPLYHGLTPLRRFAERLLGRQPGSRAEIFLGTPKALIPPLLDLVQADERDLIVDLGCGDGRVLLEAAKQRGCRGIGYELNPALVSRARAAPGDRSRVGFELADARGADLGAASIVFVFQPMPRLPALIPLILARMRPGSRLIVHEQVSLPASLSPTFSRPLFSNAGLTVAHVWVVQQAGSRTIEEKAQPETPTPEEG